MSVITQEDLSQAVGSLESQWLTVIRPDHNGIWLKVRPAKGKHIFEILFAKDKTVDIWPRSHKISLQYDHLKQACVLIQTIDDRRKKSKWYPLVLACLQALQKIMEAKAD
jgi:hypothetical protein